MGAIESRITRQRFPPGLHAHPLRLGLGHYHPRQRNLIADLARDGELFIGFSVLPSLTGGTFRGSMEQRNSLPYVYCIPSRQWPVPRAHGFPT